MEFGMYGMFEMEYVSNEYQIEYRNGARRSFKLADHRTVINPIQMILGKVACTQHIVMKGQHPMGLILFGE